MVNDSNNAQGNPEVVPSLDGLVILGVADEYGPAASGGAERAAHEIYARWGRAGATVEVHSCSAHEPFMDAGVQVHRYRGINLSKVLGAHLVLCPRMVRPFLRAAKSGRPAAIHVNTIHYTGCLVGAIAARRRRLPFIVTAQLGSVSALPWPTRLASNLYEHTVGRFILRSATRVLAVSQSVRAHVITLGARPNHVDVVENGVDHERFALAPIVEHDGPVTVMAVGRLLGNKGPDLLLEATIELATAGLDIRTVFVGDGPMRDELERRVREAGVTAAVEFAGQVADVERWLERADIVVRASYTEGLPLAVLEAMSAARCNVVSDIPPNCELVDGETNGLRFRAGDSSDLARALRRAIESPAERVAMAQQARLDARRRSWDRMAAATAQAVLAAQVPGGDRAAA